MKKLFLGLTLFASFSLLADCNIPDISNADNFQTFPIQIDFDAPRKCIVTESSWNQTYTADDGAFQYPYRILPGAILVGGTMEKAAISKSIRNLLDKDKHSFYFKNNENKDEWGDYWHYAPFTKLWGPEKGIAGGKVLNGEIIYIPAGPYYQFGSEHVYSQLIGNHFAKISVKGNSDEIINFHHGFCDYKTKNYPEFGNKVTEQFVKMECTKL